MAPDRDDWLVSIDPQVGPWRGERPLVMGPDVPRYGTYSDQRQSWPASSHDAITSHFLNIIDFDKKDKRYGSSHNHHRFPVVHCARQWRIISHFGNESLGVKVKPTLRWTLEWEILRYITLSLREFHFHVNFRMVRFAAIFVSTWVHLSRISEILLITVVFITFKVSEITYHFALKSRYHTRVCQK